MVLALAALAAAAASFPTGFGFGAGYGAGVRIGYDVIYPKIRPFAAKITDDILQAVGDLFGAGDVVTSSSTSGFEFGSSPKDPQLPFGPETGGGRTGPGMDIGGVTEGPERISPRDKPRSPANPCEALHRRWGTLKQRVDRLFAELKKDKTNLAGAQSRGNARFVNEFRIAISRKESELRKVSQELNNALNNPNNRSCATTWSIP